MKTGIFIAALFLSGNSFEQSLFTKTYLAYSHIQWHPPGIGIDFNNKPVGYVRTLFWTCQLAYDYRLDDNHRIGLAFSASDKKIHSSKIIHELAKPDADHVRLIDFTASYQNTFQFGMRYAYTHPLKDSWFMKGVIEGGLLWISQNTHVVEYAVDSGFNYSHKQFRVTSRDIKPGGFGNYLALEAGIIYLLFDNIPILAGFRLVSGHAVLHNKYIEEFDSNGIESIRHYSFDKNILQLDFRVGFSFPLN